MLRTDVGITRLRGTVQSAGRFVVLPIFHPAAAIYDRTKRDVLLDDFARLRELLDGTGASDRGPEAVEAGPEPTDVSLSDVADDPGPQARDDDSATPSQETLF